MNERILKMKLIPLGFVLLLLLNAFSITLGGEAEEAFRLALVSSRQVGANLPICNAQVTDGTRLCVCPQTTASGNAPRERGSFLLANESEKALLAAQELIGPNSPIEILSASIHNAVGLGVIDFKNSGSIFAQPEFGYDSGVVLSTGGAYRALRMANGPLDNPNSELSGSRELGGDPDIELSTDCTTLRMEFKSSIDLTLSMEYTFLSEEYSEFVDNVFDDKFVFTVAETNDSGNRQNLARLVNSELVSVDNVNYKSVPGLFQSCSANTAFDGNTVKLNSVGYQITANVEYSSKMVICDVVDQFYDSMVVIKGSTFGPCQDSAAVISCPSSTRVCPGNPVPSATATSSCGPVSVVRKGNQDEYLLPGVYTIEFELSDGSESCSYSLTVLEEPPVITNVVLFEDGTVIEEGSVTEGEVTLEFTVQDDCCTEGNSGRVLWGDGDEDEYEFGIGIFNSSNPTPNQRFSFTHQYSAQGEYTIVIEATDCSNKTSQVEVLVKVSSQCGDPKILAFLPQRTSVSVGEMIPFQYLLMVPLPCAVSISIDFQDGSELYLDQVPANSNSARYAKTMQRAYDSCATFNPILTVTSSEGKSVSDSDNVIIVSGCSTATPSPSASPTPSPTASPTASPTVVPSPTASPTEEPKYCVPEYEHPPKEDDDNDDGDTDSCSDSD